MGMILLRKNICLATVKAKSVPKTVSYTSPIELSKVFYVKIHNLGDRLCCRIFFHGKRNGAPRHFAIAVKHDTGLY